MAPDYVLCDVRIRDRLVEAIRAEKPNVPAGIVLNTHRIVPATDSAEDKAAAGRALVKAIPIMPDWTAING